MGKKIHTYGFRKKPKGRNHLENLEVDGRIIIKETLKKWVRRA
jgi:hypothetical protein